MRFLDIVAELWLCDSWIGSNIWNLKSVIARWAESCERKVWVFAAKKVNLMVMNVAKKAGCHKKWPVVTSVLPTLLYNDS